LKVFPAAVSSTNLATTLSAPGESCATVSTVEHLLATVRALNIDNLIISVKGGEVPILDGSAGTWLQLFAHAGIRHLSTPRRVLMLTKAVTVQDGEKYIRAFPHAGFHIDCRIRFDNAKIGEQSFTLAVDPASFGLVANARTFGFLRDVEYLRHSGLALGGSLDNCIVLDDDKVLNSGGLRYPDEFVRHKVLDFIGDMAMCRLPLYGRFEMCCTGHKLNNALLREIEAQGAARAVTEDALFKSAKTGGRVKELAPVSRKLIAA
jgi:UDP-3-O-[3-hydroxymyristoyl] N-acetylglucosamine deacetylase